MALIRQVRVTTAEIAESLENVRKAFSPHVVRIRFNLGEDWTGDPSIFFRVIIADEVGDFDAFYDLSKRITQKIRQEIEPHELGLLDNYNFRLLSEQVAMKDPAWN